MQANSSTEQGDMNVLGHAVLGAHLLDVLESIGYPSDPNLMLVTVLICLHHSAGSSSNSGAHLAVWALL